MTESQPRPERKHNVAEIKQLTADLFAIDRYLETTRQGHNRSRVCWEAVGKFRIVDSPRQIHTEFEWMRPDPRKKMATYLRDPDLEQALENPHSSLWLYDQYRALSNKEREGPDGRWTGPWTDRNTSTGGVAIINTQQPGPPDVTLLELVTRGGGEHTEITRKIKLDPTKATLVDIARYLLQVPGFLVSQGYETGFGFYDDVEIMTSLGEHKLPKKAGGLFSYKFTPKDYRAIVFNALEGGFGGPFDLSNVMKMIRGETPGGSGSDIVALAGPFGIVEPGKLSGLVDAAQAGGEHIVQYLQQVNGFFPGTPVLEAGSRLPVLPQLTAGKVK